MCGFELKNDEAFSLGLKRQILGLNMAVIVVLAHGRPHEIDVHWPFQAAAFLDLKFVRRQIHWFQQ
jgi:hypothetical protein